MKKPLTGVSDHAVLRYLERVQGLDVELLRREIGRKVDLAFAHPGCTGIVVEGFRYHLQNGVVTTVIEASKHDLRTGRVRRERPE